MVDVQTVPLNGAYDLLTCDGGLVNKLLHRCRNTICDEVCVESFNIIVVPAQNAGRAKPASA